jgi:hypothetical protein
MSLQSQFILLLDMFQPCHIRDGNKWMRETSVYLSTYKDNFQLFPTVDF